MKFKIGFTAENCNNAEEIESDNIYKTEKAEQPRKSVVRVFFPERSVSYLYFNDKFDLHVGDKVFVEGTMEGIRGKVTDVNYCFKIKLSDYKKVISVAHSDVSGKFYMTDSHMISFDKNSLPPEKASTWYVSKHEDDEEYIFGELASGFNIFDMDMDIQPQIETRGFDYYFGERVRYVCVNGDKGIAYVQGTKNYTVEFRFDDNYISDLVCDCPCGFTCKHEFAAMLQLKEILELIGEKYLDIFEETGYFSAVNKADFFINVMSSKNGTFSLD